MLAPSNYYLNYDYDHINQLMLLPSPEHSLWSPEQQLPAKCIPLNQKQRSQKAGYAEQILSTLHICLLTFLSDQATTIMLLLYPTSASSFASTQPLASLKQFIRDFLKKSKTTFSTLQLALLYLVSIKNNTIKTSKEDLPILQCGRRMFLAALVIASKVLLEPPPKNSAWSKLSGLPLAEINLAERLMLQSLDYKTVISLEEFVEWNNALHQSARELFKFIELKASKESNNAKKSESIFSVSGQEFNSIKPINPVSLDSLKSELNQINFNLVSANATTFSLASDSISQRSAPKLEDIFGGYPTATSKNVRRNLKFAAGRRRPGGPCVAKSYKVMRIGATTKSARS